MPKDVLMESLASAISKVVDKEASKGVPIEQIRKKLGKIDYSNLLIKMVEVDKNQHVEYFKQIMFEKSIEMRAQNNEFLAHHEQIWWKGFVASEAMYSISLEIGELFGEYMSGLRGKQKKERDDNNYRFLSLRELHARSCQVYLEILTLVEAGFADGAFARWRTMFELSVIAHFLSNNNNDVSKAFYEASNQDCGRHDWAKTAECFKECKKGISFDMLWNQCGLKTPEWTRQYQMANKIVHASPQGTFKRLSVLKTPKSLCAGRSDYGVSVPAVHAALSLACTTASFLSIHTYGDGLVHSYCLLEWIDVVREAYDEAENTCFQDNETDSRNDNNI